MHKKKGILSFLVIVSLFVFLGGAISQKSISNQDGHTSGHETDWYYFDWILKAPYVPTFQVLDTESSLGPYANKTKTITLKDLIKFHGHACDGLFTVAGALYVGFKHLYPDGVIDRTDTGVITNNSPCYGDVAAYLTGGRIRFGTQKIDKTLGNEFILYRFSTHEAVKVLLKPGVFPQAIVNLEEKVRSGKFTMTEMRELQKMQWEFAKSLVEHPLEEAFNIQVLDGFIWESDPYAHLGKRGDVVNKDILKSRERQNEYR
ncbi:MAG: formylmethanofuran dehydrogenase subunit E family protein [Candidatus Omnitrophica bacterium]|nr:formylmethanofuran dehydrogenase subunit E family protein [Candidatus Omnitrophota bacterium]